MNKLKSFFTTPLISSGTKIQPWILETPKQDPLPQPAKKAALRELPKIVIDLEPKPQPLKRSQTSKQPLKPAERKKRHSIQAPPTREKFPAEQVKFDFEPFEEIVDKKKLGIKNKVEEDITPSSASPKRGRSSSFSGGDHSVLKKNGEPFKKSNFFGTKGSSATSPTNFDGFPPSPGIRSPLNMSKVDENVGLLNLNYMGENMKDGMITMDIIEDAKKKKLFAKNIHENSLQMISLKGTMDNLDAENLLGIKDSYRRQTGELTQATSEREYLKNNNIGESTLQFGEDPKSKPGDLIRNLSENLSIVHKETSKKDMLENKMDNNSQEESGSYTESHLDSLLEENPFQNYKPSFTHAETFKRQRTKLRDDPKYKKSQWILFPDDPWRKRWDWVIGLTLVYTALFMPVRVAFITDDLDHGEWTALDWTSDGIFLIDIFVTFFSAYFNSDDNLITSRKKICKNYLMGWFVLDVASILPFQYFTNSQTTAHQQRINNLVRVARIPRLYRLVKIIKLIRMIKVIKDRDKFKAYMNDFLRLTPAYERLFISVLGILLFCHIATCLWYVLVGLNDSNDDWLTNNGFDLYMKSEIYVAILYYVVQTVVTVGYGDLAPKTTEERLMACFLIVFGVVFYSLFIGFVSSLINDVETMNQKFNERLHTLYRLKKDYALPVFFTKKLLTAIKYQNKKTIESKDFINDLPTSLAIELSYLMHREIVHNITFLQNRPKAFIACLCPLLRAITIHKKEVIFREGDPADEIYFIKSGTVGYVLPKYQNECFLKVREGYFFGEIDLLFYGEFRKYTVTALKDCELYVLNKKDFKHVFLSEHRQIGTALYDNAYLRKQSTRKIYKEALEICKKRKEDPTESEAKIRQLHTTIKSLLDKEQNSSSDSDDSDDSMPNPLMGIVEEPEEEDEEVHKVAKTTSILPEVQPEEDDTEKSGVNFMQLRAALAFKRKLAPKNSNTSQKELKKGDAKFGELNKKIDGLESKLAKLMTIGNNMKAKSIKDLNALDKTGRTNSFTSLMLKSPQARSPVAGNRNPLTIEDGLASPTESDGSSVFKSPNALRRNMFLKNAKESPNSIFKINFQMKNLKLPSDSPVSQHGAGDESLRFLTTPKAALNKNGGKYSELRSVGTVETEQNLLSESNLLTSHRNTETNNERIEEDKEEVKRDVDIRKGSLEVAVNDIEEKTREGALIFLQKTGKLRKFKPSQGELRKNISSGSADDKSSKVNVEDL